MQEGRETTCNGITRKQLPVQLEYPRTILRHNMFPIAFIHQLQCLPEFTDQAQLDFGTIRVVVHHFAFHWRPQ